MRIEEVERMISYQKRTIQNAKRITNEFKSGYIAALDTLSASIDAQKGNGEEELIFQRIG